MTGKDPERARCPVYLPRDRSEQRTLRIWSQFASTARVRPELMYRDADVFNRNNHPYFIGLRAGGCVYPVNNERELCKKQEASFLF
jgi:hypothetical protein